MKATKWSVRIMRDLMVLITLVAFHASIALAQTPAAAHAAVEKQIVTNERAINDAFAKGDAKAFHASAIAPDAMSVDAGGIMRVSAPELDKIIQSSKISTWSIDASQFAWVNDTTVVYMYRWTGKGTVDGQPVPSPVWASTVWANRGGKWVATFHQETTAMPPPPPARMAAPPASKK